MSYAIPHSWQLIFDSEAHKPYFIDLMSFIEYEYSHWECFPKRENIFNALHLTPFEDVKVVILGQDPYHTLWAAMWLSFSIPNNSNIQPSLRNIFKEVESDIGIKRSSTDLTDWGNQWVLLLNSVLTVQSGKPASHSWRWWEIFTDSIIRILSEKWEGIIFVLWGNYAIAKSSLIDITKHHIIKSAHPSPFSAHRGFFGSRPFSKVNQILRNQWKADIRWG